MRWAGRLGFLGAVLAIALAFHAPPAQALSHDVASDRAVLTDGPLTQLDDFGPPVSNVTPVQVAERVGREPLRLILALVGCAVLVILGAGDWVPRIGLRAYGGVVALTSGVALLAAVASADLVLGGYTGFGAHQKAGLIAAIVLLAAGAGALWRLRGPTAGRPGSERAVRRLR
ncbi:MAG: hypothetical protein HKN74_14910 [Acidimicrobiia bacterium]|nr:hypothetical protein [Acidimicrobiia bacterium]NNF11564.1 hypothetical protein [Acidimicrobiia bacterium]